MIGRGAFQGFNNSIFRTLGRHAQSVTGALCRLMMAGVHAHAGAKHLRKSRCGLYLNLMGKFALASSLVIDVCVLDVLQETSCSPDVKRLQAIADAQNGLVQVMRVLKEKLVEI